MTRYVGVRLASGLLTLFLFVTLLFFLINIVIPGDWVSGMILTAEDAAALRESLGLDHPLWQQYLSWLLGVFTLSLGESFGQGSVWDALMASLPSTLLVLSIGLTTAFVLGGWLGRVAAHGERSYFSGPITFIAILFLTAFPPVLAILMEQGVLNALGWSRLGVFGELDPYRWWVEGAVFSPAQVIWRMIAVLVLTVGTLWGLDHLIRKKAGRSIPRWVFLIAMVGLPLLIWSRMGLSDFVFDITGSLALLLTGVVLLTFGDVLLVTRAAMDDVMLEDYVMVARAKGLREKDVRNRHSARPALLPVLSRFTVSIPYFLTGLIILEVVFAGAGFGGVGVLQRVTAPGGLGSLLFRAMADQDIPMIMGGLLAVGVLTLLLRITLDVVHAYLDPRIRFGGTDVV